jgi:hypothetical protein
MMVGCPPIMWSRGGSAAATLKGKTTRDEEKEKKRNIRCHS